MLDPGRRVLITNIRLADLTGTEVYVRDLALELQRRGQLPVVHAPTLGPIADGLRARGVAVTDDLGSVDVVPDVIHANHTLEAAVAAIRFPDVPMVFVSHSSIDWYNEAPLLSAVRRYVAVDVAVRDRLLADGVPPERLRIVGNGIDLRRFRPRASPLPPEPRRALVFSNVTMAGDWVASVRAACDRAGLALDVAGINSTTLVRPEEVLPGYDIVFAKARYAMEALAVGCAVVVCDSSGVGGMVTAENLDVLRPLNFGLRTMIQPHAPDVLDEAIAAYDPQSAAKAAARFRAEGDLVQMVDQLVAAHDEAIATPAPSRAEREQDARRLSSLLGRASADRWEAADLRSRVAFEQAGVAAGRQHIDELAAELGSAASARAAGQAELAAMRTELEAIRATRTWRARDRVLPWYRRVRRAARRG